MYVSQKAAADSLAPPPGDGTRSKSKNKKHDDAKKALQYLTKLAKSLNNCILLEFLLICMYVE